MCEEWFRMPSTLVNLHYSKPEYCTTLHVRRHKVIWPTPRTVLSNFKYKFKTIEDKAMQRKKQKGHSNGQKKGRGY